MRHQFPIIFALFLILPILIGKTECQNDFWASLSQPLVSVGSDAKMPLKDFGMDFSRLNDYSSLFGRRKKRAH
ncbi:hypothetical protein niasHT_021395 [Heterodera trifolii]|uniref:Uncharacterized protein n=1 Tax=Heterodera trifolii TaxID=157864 RepID=A0ABD2K6M1_9BILA